MERERLLSHLGEDVVQHWEVRLCGFGVIAAATMTTRWIGQVRPDEVLLAGIAGAFELGGSHLPSRFGSLVFGSCL